MSTSKPVFSSRKNNYLIFSLIIAFFLIVLIKGGDSYYNNLRSWVELKTNETVVLPKIEESPFRLGLDLQGGAQLVYRADVSQIPDSDKDDLLEGVRGVIERRINAFGVSEPVIQVNKTVDNDYRVIVELAGIKSVDDAIKEIGETPKLEFKEQDISVSDISEDSLRMMNEYNNGLELKMEEIYSKIIDGEDFVALAANNNTPKALVSGDNIPLGSQNDGDLGWISPESNAYVYDLVKNLQAGQSTGIVETEFDYTIFKLEEKRTSSGILSEDNNRNKEEYRVREIFLEKMTKEYLIGLSDNWKNTQLTGKNLSKAVIQFNPNNNRPEISLEFDREGAELFAEITERNIGRPVAIYLDGYPISVPTVNEKISGGKAVISGNFSIAEAKELVQRLKAGALPVPIELINQKTVGATLGQKSVSDSLGAGIIGLVLVALFMILFYRLFGLVSVFSLLIYGATVLAIFKALPLAVALIIGLFFVGLMLITFDELKILDVSLMLLFVVVGVILLIYGINAITLTLAGLAGFILSIGMAVDANVLIFERIKEELRSGRTIRDSIDEGIRRAWPSIRDGNVSTLLICLILMSFGTGVLKGFGTTLFIGVSVSMFSAIVITRNFLNLFLSNRVKNLSLLLGVKRKNNNKINN